jgi:hypothetical protein
LVKSQVVERCGKGNPRDYQVWIKEMNADEPLKKCRESAIFCQKCLKYDKHDKFGFVTISPRGLIVL